MWKNLKEKDNDNQKISLLKKINKNKNWQDRPERGWREWK